MVDVLQGLTVMRPDTRHGPGMLIRRLAALVGLVSCGCGQAQLAPTRCDPLAPTVLPITAGNLRGVGKDAGGTLYMIDESESSPSGERLFVSRGMTLARRTVSGSGGSGSGAGSVLVVSTGEAGVMFHVEIEMGASGPAKMGLLRGPLPSTRFFIIGVDSEVLHILGAGDIAGYQLENLPGTFSIEHLASLADGRLIVVTSPDVDTHYEDFRLFLGTVDDLVERPVVNVTRGSFTTIAFLVDGREAKAVFGSPLNTAVSSELTLDGQSQPLTLADPRAPPAAAAFFCIARP